MIARRFIVVIAAVVLLCAPSRGFAAVSVSSADEICPATDDPCNITKSFSVADGTVLDFGQRAVRITGNGRLDGGAGSWTLNCGEFFVDVGTNIGIKARGPSGFGTTEGGVVTINAFRQCSIDSSTLCISDRQCSFGLCDKKVCSGDTQFSCASNARCQLGSCSAFVCSRASTRLCATDGDCSFGTCNVVSRRCSNNSSVFCISDAQCDLGPCDIASPRCDGRLSRSCSVDADCDLGSCSTNVCALGVSGTNRVCASDADCFDGECSIGNGSISINGKIRADGFEAGSIQIRGAGDITLSQLIDLDATNVDSDGGFLELESGAGSVNLNGSIDARGGGDSLGGEISAIAGTDVLVNGPINAAGGAFDGGIVDLIASRDISINSLIDLSANNGDGSGGELTADAGRNIEITSVGLVVSNGHASVIDNSGGDGGTQDYTVTGDFVIASGGLLQSDGSRPDGFGGDITVTAGNNITLEGTIAALARGVEGEGGVVELLADQVLTVAATGLLDVVALNSGAGSVDLSSGSDMFYDGTIDARSANGPGNSVLFSCGANLNMSGSVIIGGVVNAGPLNRFNGSFDADACHINIQTGALIDNTGDFGDNLFVARNGFVMSANTSISADSATGINKIFSSSTASPPVIGGNITPAPELIVDPGLIPCPECGNAVVEVGESCDDGNTVSGDGCSDGCQVEGCLSGTAAPGFPIVPLCFDGLDCTVDSCDQVAASCVHDPVDSKCNDGNVCTVGVCVVSTGCEFVAADGSCDDANACTTGDTCNAGVCAGVLTVSCDDGDVCTNDWCSPSSGQCLNTNNAAACDDAIACTGNDTCAGGVCSGVSNCPFGETCDTIIGTCVSASSVCGNGVVEAPDELCDDGDTIWAAGEFCSAQCLTLACGDPNNDGLTTASDALFTLRAAVGVSSCDSCVCNVDNTGSTSASDALRLLMAAVGVPGVGISCPACP